MATAGHSRQRRGARQPSGFALRSLDFLRALAGIAAGKSRRIESKRHVGHGRPRAHAHSARHRPRERIVTRQISAARLTAAVALFLFVGWISWRIVADTAARNLAVSAPADALNWTSDLATALDQLAQEELRKPDGDVDAARAWADRALRSHPLDERALFLLAMAAERKGDAAGAEKLMRAAGARTWRNLGTQLWLFEHAVRSKDVPAALAHADAMFRVEPNLLAPLFPTIAAFTTEPRGLKALADFLAAGPPWRDWVLGSLSARLYDKSHLDQLYAALIESRRPPTTEELRAYLDRLIKDERYELAYQIWRQTMRRESQAKGEVPYNGDFNGPADGMPFNWSVKSTAGAEVEIVPAEGAKGRALRVQFSGARVQFANVRQLILLPPGQYRLVGWVKADDLHAPRGLWWRVLCAAEPGTTLAHSDLVSGSLPWRQFSVDFDVPANGCKAQKLQLELPARIASEQQIEGQVWYRNLRIVPAAASMQPSG